MVIGTRIALGFAAVLILTAIVGFIGWNGLSRFSSHVDSSVQTTALSTRLHYVESLVLSAKTSQDTGLLSEALSGLAPIREDAETLAQNAKNASQADSLSRVADAIAGYEASLDRFSLAAAESRQRLAEMQEKTNRLEALTDQLSSAERREYEERSEALEAAYALQRDSLSMANSSDQLLKSTLTARQNEALYRQSRDPAFAEAANTAIKQMYMAGLRLKKLAAGTEDEAAVKDLTGAVNLYRKSLGDLVEVYAYYDQAAEAEAVLESTSRQISAFAATVAESQREAAGGADGARRNEIAATADALIMAMLRARQAEAAFRLSRQLDDAETAAAEIKPMFLAALKLKKLVEGSKVSGAVGKIAGSVNGYRKAFEGLVDIERELKAVAGVEEKLSTASNDIAALTDQITTKALAAYESANQEAETSREKLENAVEASAAAASLLGIVRSIRLAENIYVSSGGRNDVSGTVREGTDRALVTTEELSALLSGSALADSVAEIGALATAYQADFETVVASLDDAARFEQEMQTALETVSQLVEGIATQTTVTMQGEKSFNIVTIAVGSATAIVLGLALAFLIGRGIAGPVGALTKVMERLSNNDLDVDVPGEDRRDELGAMATTVKIFKDNAQEVERLKREKEETDRRQAEEKRRTLSRLADDFNQSVGSIVQIVNASATQMTASAQTMSATATEAMQRSQTVASAAEQTSSNVQTVAAAADEMHNSIDEIARQVSDSTKIAGRAVDEARKTNVTVSGLAQAAQRIGDVVTLIQDIAEQTNLLALNATIEAARAGDAGKGFAVVASEVKNLAGQTAQATEEIAQQINNMQMVSSEAVGAIKGIGMTISDIANIASAIASAVEEQGAATREIARNIQEAARGTGEVSSNISSVNDAASQTGTAATDVLKAAEDLSHQGASLSEQVQRFLHEVRAA